MAREMLFNGMYLREALGRCRDLEEEVSRTYEELASQHGRSPEIARAWRHLAEEDRGRSRQLGVLLAVHEALNDDGPFLVGLERRCTEYAQQVRETHRRVHEGITPPRAVELCAKLEYADLDNLFIELRDLSRPAVKRFSERLYKRVGSHPYNHDRLTALNQIATTAQDDGGTGATVAHSSGGLGSNV